MASSLVDEYSSPSALYGVGMGRRMVKLTLLRLYRQYRENLWFGGYLAGIVLLAPAVATLLASGWEASQLLRSLTELVVLIDLDPNNVILAGFGFIAGLLGLMLIDYKKRWQGVAIGIGFAIIIAQLASAGQLIAPDTTTDDLGWALPGLLLGGVVGGGVQLVKLRSLGPQEFRAAPRLVYLTTTVVLLVALVELHVNYPAVLAVSSADVTVLSPDPVDVAVTPAGLGGNLIVAAAAAVMLRRFTQYDADEEFFVIGPPASGKSLFLIGAYLEALGDIRGELRRSEALDPSHDLMELVENLDQDNSEWIVEATGRGELRTLEFRYVSGSLLPRKVTISSLDYAGEHLSRLPGVLTGDTEDPADELRQIAAGVTEATTLILLIDAERFVNNEGLSLAEYFEILKASEDSNVILVATKSDIFADMFWEEHAQSPQDDFAAFREFVEAQLTQSEQFASLLRQTPTSEIHPVYYETAFNEAGERVPVRDAQGRVVTVGFKQLLEKLGQ